MAGGDARIALDPLNGTNRYGCTPFPDPALAAFGSSTASVISTAGFAAADRLRDRLALASATETPEIACKREFERIREELLHLCELSDLPGLETLFASSGTDLHGMVGQLVCSTPDKPTLAIMVETRETGSGVAAALSACDGIEIAGVAIRRDDGSPRPALEVDAEVEARVAAAAAQGRRVLLMLTDVSKTGLIAPSPACAAKLHAQLPGTLDVLVDACQFRIATSTLRAYLERGFMVGLTGSKFVAGPTFSGVLMVPASAASGLHDHFQRFGKAHSEPVNLGLLLRWEAALEELRAFRALPDDTVGEFLQTFARSIHAHLAANPAFELLATRPLDRRPLSEAPGWDTIQTIFPFLLYDIQAGRRPLNPEETARIGHLMRLDLSGKCNFHTPKTAALRCQLGQPVACGSRDGVPVSALRLCLSARLVVEAATNGGLGARPVIERAITALDKAARLANECRDSR